MLLGVVLVFLFSTCRPPGRAEEETETESAFAEEGSLVRIERFDLEVRRSDSLYNQLHFNNLLNKYPEFFPLWLQQIAGIVPPQFSPEQVRSEGLQSLREYMSDPYIGEVFSDCRTKFEDLKALEKNLAISFRSFPREFPGKPIPRLISYVAPFTTNVITTDSLLGIGLHFYLGQDYRYYSSLNLPQYMQRRFRSEYMWPDLIKGWIDSEYRDDSTYADFLSQMIYQGKVLYAMDRLCPGLADSLYTGYSRPQQKWLEENEYNVWTFFIEKKLIFNSNQRTYMKYIHDGNGTPGFPEEAPSRLGAWIGWQMVKSYMEKRSDWSLAELFARTDYRQFLTESNYKPTKP